MNPHRVTAYILLLVVSVIWGVASPVIKFTERGFPPLPFLTYRFLISSVLALIFLLPALKRLTAIRQNFKEIVIYGLLATPVGLGLLFLGIEKTTVLDATLISATAPIIAEVMGAIFLKETITRREKIGTAIAFGGTLLTIFEPLLSNGVFAPSQLLGNLLVFAYVLATTGAAIFAKRLLRLEVRPADMTNISFILGFLTILPLTLLVYSPAHLLNLIVTTPLPYHLGVFYMALLSGSLAYWLWARAQKTIEVSEAGLFTYLIPLFSAPLAIVWLKESVSPYFIAGAVVIGAGVAIAEYKANKV